MIELLLFWTCALFAIGGALGAALVRNLFHGALLLGLALVGVAGLYLFLEAQWLACVQVVVYLGGILVLILFAVLFSSDVMGRLQRTPWSLRLAGTAGALLAAIVAVRLLQVVVANGKGLDRARGTTGVADVIGGAGSSIGDLLMTSWYVPFLAAGLLLTVALIAAVSTVHRFRRPAGVSRG